MDAKEAIEELRLSALGEWVPNKEAVEVAIQALRDVSILEKEIKKQKERIMLRPIAFLEPFPENMEEAAWVDEDGVAWRRPTAEAYARTCKALRKKEQYVETLNNSVGYLKREQQELRLAICQQCKCSGNTHVCYDKRSGLACQYFVGGPEARATKTTRNDGK